MEAEGAYPQPPFLSVPLSKIKIFSIFESAEPENAYSCKNLSYERDYVTATRRLPEIIVSRSLFSCPHGQVFELLR